MGKNSMSLRGRDVLALADFSADEIQMILETAKEMKNIIHRDIKPQNVLVKDDGTIDFVLRAKYQNPFLLRAGRQISWS